MAFFVKGQQQGRAIGSARNCDQHAIAGRDQPGLAKPIYQCARDPTIYARMVQITARAIAISARMAESWSRFWGGHGGAGWTRTTDNAIMSRALYHLSYGTSCAGVRLTSRLRSCLELALLDSVLGDRDALPLVHQNTSLKCALRAPGGNKDEAGAPPASWLLQMVAEVGFEPTTFGL